MFLTDQPANENLLHNQKFQLGLNLLFYKFLLVLQMMSIPLFWAARNSLLKQLELL